MQEVLFISGHLSKTGLNICLFLDFRYNVFIMFAIVETGGKQYKVAAGDVLKVEKLPKPENGKIVFDKVLLINDEGSTQIGKPYLEGATVTADFIEEGKGKKVTVLHYKAKVRHRKVYGHRQPFTKVKVSKIS